MIKVTKTEYGTVYATTGVTGGGGTHTTNPIQKKEWVGLTDDEIHKIEQECDQKFEDYFEFANAIEAKLKEKNS